MDMMELLWTGFVGWFIGAPTIVKAPVWGTFCSLIGCAERGVTMEQN